MSPAILAEVLTLEEVAAYLRLPADVVLRQATHGSLPGRKIEDNWRFLKSAIDLWLSVQPGRIALLQQVGVFADDPLLPELRSTIYQERGRSEVDEEFPL